MEKAKRRRVFFVLSGLIILVAFSHSVAYSHSGGTDAKGGHYNSSTGEYHFHHGHPAHQHTGGECPYDFTDNTVRSSRGSSGGGSVSSRTSTLSKEPVLDVAIRAALNAVFFASIAYPVVWALLFFARDMLKIRKLNGVAFPKRTFLWAIFILFLWGIRRYYKTILYLCLAGCVVVWFVVPILSFVGETLSELWKRKCSVLRSNPKQNKWGYKMKIGIRIILAIILGVLIYCIGWIVGSLVGYIQNLFLLVAPFMLSRREIWIASGAFAANFGSYAVFGAIFPPVKYKKQAMVTWSFVLAMVAVVYTVLCLLGGDYHLLIYPASCILPVVWLIYWSFKDLSEVESVLST